MDATRGSGPLLVAVTLLLPAIALAQARAFAIDEGSSVRFEARGEGLVRPANGQFAAVSGRLALDPSDLSTAHGHVQVLLSSVQTPDSAWDLMFREAPFLDLDEHPRAQFALSQVRGPSSLPADTWVDVELVGRFTLHGITRDVELPARVKWSPDSDGPRGPNVERMHVLCNFFVRWDEHGIRVPSPADRELAGRGASIHVDLHYRAL